MINVSELASIKLNDVLASEGQSDSALLRIIITSEQGGGAKYTLSMEHHVKDDDTVVHANGVRIVVDSESVPLLEGTELDYVDGLMRSGFVINNPNFVGAGGGCGAEGGCACGGNCSCGGH